MPFDKDQNGIFVALFGKLKKRVENVRGHNMTADISQAGKWAFYFVLIGVIAGLGSIVFHYLCQLGLHYFMDLMAGYRPPTPAGEHHLLAPTSTPINNASITASPVERNR